MFVHPKQWLFLSVYMNDIKMAGENQNMARMWKKLMKHVDLDEPTSFLDHVYLGSTQRECKPNETIIEQHTQMFESRISAGATEKITRVGKASRKTVAWSYDMERHAQKCVGRYCELAELESVEELSKVCSQMVLKCLYLARIGRPDILFVGRPDCCLV